MHGVGQETLVDRAIVHVHVFAGRVPCTEVGRLVGVQRVELACVKQFTDLLQPIAVRDNVRQVQETEEPPADLWVPSPWDHVEERRGTVARCGTEPVVKTDLGRGLIMVKGSVPGVKGAWVSVRDAVKRKLPDAAPKPGAFKLPEAAAAPAAE